MKNCDENVWRISSFRGPPREQQPRRSWLIFVFSLANASIICIRQRNSRRDGVGKTTMKQWENNANPAIDEVVCCRTSTQTAVAIPQSSHLHEEKWVNNFLSAACFSRPFFFHFHLLNVFKDTDIDSIYPCMNALWWNSFMTVRFIVRLPYWFMAKFRSSLHPVELGIWDEIESVSAYRCEGAS